MLKFLLIGFAVSQVITTTCANDIETISLLEGSTIDLPCNISSDPEEEVESISWHKYQNLLCKLKFRQHGHLSKQEGKNCSSVHVSDQESVLHVEALTHEQEGLYKCRVRYDSTRREEYFVMIKVLDVPQEEILDSTEIDKDSRNVSENENEPAKEEVELIDTGTEGENLTSSSLIERVTVSSTESLRSKYAPTENNTGVCGAPPVLEGALTQLRGNEHAVGTVASYRCDFGYVPQGSGKFQAVCEQDGGVKWIYPKVACVPRSCGDPGYVTSGHRVGNLFTFPNKVEFECDEGYKLRGTGVRYCLANGEWSGRLPTCEEIYCSIPPNPENGRVRYSSLEYGSLLRYECDKGFVLRNHHPRYCSDNETWSNDPPECREAACEMPEAPKHGSVKLVGEPKVGSLALYSCEGNRKIVGATTSRCLETGEWTFETPKCLSSCMIPVVGNGTVGRLEKRIRYYKEKEYFVPFEVGQRIDNGEKVVLSCKDGFFPESSPNGASLIDIGCEDGNWNQPMKCNTSSCYGDPPPMENGYPVVSYRHHGYVIYYKCNDKHYSKKSGHVNCEYGKWVGYTPICTDTRCYVKDLDVEGLSKPQKQHYFNFESFAVSCMQGYKASGGLQNIFCKNAQWDAPSKPCIKEEKLSTISLSRPHSSSALTTESSNLFSALAVVGKPSTSDPKIPDEEECFCTLENNYSVSLSVDLKGLRLESGSKIRRGDTVSVNCRSNMALYWSNNGLRLSGPVNLTCDICERWQSHSNFPVCRNPSQWDPVITLDSKTKVYPDGSVEIQEKENAIFTCKFKESYPIWSVGTSRYIEPKYTASSSLMALIEIRDIKASDAGNYECYTRNHYNPKMSSTVLKVHVSGSMTRCPDIFHEEYFATYNNDRKIGSEALLFCRDSSKAILGTGKRECLSNGKWSGTDDQTCIEVTCSAYPSSDDLEISYSNGNRVGSIAKFKCKNPGELIGNPEALCLGNGTWNTLLPSCRTVTCSTYPSSNDLDISYSNGNKVGSIARFKCKNSAALIGHSVAFCLGNGTWDHLLPSCTNVACPRLSLSDGLQITYTNGLYAESIATFYCEPPSTLIGPDLKTCDKNGEWSNNLQVSCSSPGCSVDALLSVVPENVVPNMENVTSDSVPSGTELHLLCESNLVLTGDKKTRCLAGSWEIGSSKCESLCRLDSSPSPHLIISPRKEFYSLGEFILLSCAPNYVLTSDVERVMCLGGSWTDTIPGCTEDLDIEW